VEHYFELRRRPVPGAGRGLREYRLYGADGGCLLSARIKGSRMLPRLVELTSGVQGAARIRRKGLLGRAIVLEDQAGQEQLRLTMPVMTSAARTRPFDLVDRRGQIAWRLAPPSGLKDRGSLGGDMLRALFDSDLVLVSGQELLGTTRPSRKLDGPRPENSLGLLRFVGRMKRQIKLIAAEFMGRPASGEEVEIGRFEPIRDDPRITPPLIMLLLLFRRFDYGFMRDLS
jgi:hypothetical protein